MPLNPADPAYIAEVTPASIAAMERPLCSAFKVGLEAFGAKGNLVHYSGYHRSRQWILNSRDSRYGSSDYSVTQALDKSGDQRWISAFDFTPGAWGTPDNRARMRQITGRVHAAAKARDPRLANLREFAGTLDGKNVNTFNCSDGSLKSPFDSSHLDHVHGSFWRGRAANDHSGIVEVMLGDLMEEPDMTPDQDQRLKNVEQWLVHFLAGEVTGVWPHSTGVVPKMVPNEKLNALAGGGVDPAAVAALVAEQLGPLLPTLADIEKIVAAKVKEALNGTRLTA